MTTEPKIESTERFREKLLDTVKELDARRKAECERHLGSVEQIKSVLANRQKLFDVAKQLKAARKPNHQRQFRSVRRTNSAAANRNDPINALRDEDLEALVKLLEAASKSSEILQKANDVLQKRIASGELSDNMLLRIIDSLAKSTAYVAYVAVDRPPQAKRRAPASRLGRQSRRAPIRRTHGQSR